MRKERRKIKEWNLARILRTILIFERNWYWSLKLQQTRRVNEYARDDRSNIIMRVIWKSDVFEDCATRRRNIGEHGSPLNSLEQTWNFSLLHFGRFRMQGRCLKLQCPWLSTSIGVCFTFLRLHLSSTSVLSLSFSSSFFVPFSLSLSFCCLSPLFFRSFLCRHGHQSNVSFTRLSRDTLCFNVDTRCRLYAWPANRDTREFYPTCLVTDRERANPVRNISGWERGSSPKEIWWHEFIDLRYIALVCYSLPIARLFFTPACPSRIFIPSYGAVYFLETPRRATEHAYTRKISNNNIFFLLKENSSGERKRERKKIERIRVIHRERRSRRKISKEFLGGNSSETRRTASTGRSSLTGDPTGHGTR